MARENLFEGEGGEGSGEGVNPQGSGEGGGGVAPQFDIEGVDLDSLPDDFRGEKGIKVSSILERAKAHDRLTELGIGEAPDAYEVNIPDIEGASDDQKAAMSRIFDKDDVLVGAFHEVSRDMGLTQAAHDKFMASFAKKFIERGEQTVAKEMESLGRDGAELVSRNRDFYSAHLSAEEFSEFSSMMTSASALKVMDSLRKKFVNGSGFKPPGGAPTGNGLTEKDLRAKMQQPAYFDRNHPEHSSLVKEVAEGYDKLYSKA